MASQFSLTEPSTDLTDVTHSEQQSSQLTKSRAAASYARRRAGNACLICRARKTKCDNQRPVCGFCLATGGNCRYMDSDLSQFDRASLAILERISQLETSLRSHIDTVLGQRLTRASHGAPTSPSFDFNVLAEESNRLTEPEDLETEPLEPESSPPFNLSDSENVSEDMPPSTEVMLQASEMSIDSVLRWPIFRSTIPELTSEIDTPIIERFPRESSRPLVNITSVLHHLSFSSLSQLIENFLINNHVKNPVLDVEDLRIYAQEFNEIGLQWDDKSCLVLLVCAISTLSAPIDREITPGPSKSVDTLETAEAYFQASQRRIGMLYHDNTLLAAQCTFLTGVYLMSTMQILAAWKSFVHAASQCLAYLMSSGRLKQPNAGKTEKATRETVADLKQRHVEDSLYWSCLKSELELRFELCLPGSGLNELGYANTYPSPPVDLQTNNTPFSPDTFSSSPGSSLSVFDRQNLETGWFFYLAEIATKRIVTSAFKWQYKTKTAAKLGDQDLEMAVTEFERQVSEWYDALPPSMRFPRDPSIPTNEIMRYILRGHMLDIKEMIRFPAAQATLGSSQSILSPQNSAITLRLTQEFMTNAVDRIEANREGFFHRHQGTWLGLRSCSRSAVQLLGMACKCRWDAREAGLDAQTLERKFLPANWTDTILIVLKGLSYWKDASRDLYLIESAIRHLMKVYERLVVADV